MLLMIVMFIYFSFQCCVLGFAATVISDRETGRSRGFGFVSFDSEDSANTAITEMDGKVRRNILMQELCSEGSFLKVLSFISYLLLFKYDPGAESTVLIVFCLKILSLINFCVVWVI